MRELGHAWVGYLAQVTKWKEVRRSPLAVEEIWVLRNKQLCVLGVVENPITFRVQQDVLQRNFQKINFVCSFFFFSPSELKHGCLISPFFSSPLLWPSFCFLSLITLPFPFPPTPFITRSYFRVQLSVIFIPSKPHCCSVLTHWNWSDFCFRGSRKWRWENRKIISCFAF